MSSDKKVSRTSKTPDFQTNLQSIERLVEKLEDADTPLEKSLEHFEQGILLIRQAQAQLAAAEQKVLQLTEKDGEIQFSAFTNPDEEDAEQS